MPSCRHLSLQCCPAASGASAVARRPAEHDGWRQRPAQHQQAPAVAVSEKLVDYCSRHRISFNWRLDGRLKGLKKMIDERRG
ncbi:hypothetical protein [Bradyrhizobium sp. S3.2.12]|uniref:hypothetical protein n=1 Tax=Bradyrhizobium sp. S3.2.12 TaxID=3156387 RepID=UPI003395BAEB